MKLIVKLLLMALAWSLVRSAEQATVTYITMTPNTYDDHGPGSASSSPNHLFLYCREAIVTTPILHEFLTLHYRLDITDVSYQVFEAKKARSVIQQLRHTAPNWGSSTGSSKWRSLYIDQKPNEPGCVGVVSEGPFRIELVLSPMDPYKQLLFVIGLLCLYNWAYLNAIGCIGLLVTVLLSALYYMAEQILDTLVNTAAPIDLLVHNAFGLFDRYVAVGLVCALWVPAARLLAPDLAIILAPRNASTARFMMRLGASLFVLAALNTSSIAMHFIEHAFN